MEISTDFMLKLEHEEAKALTHLLGVLSRGTQKEFGLVDDEININNDLYRLLSPFFEFND